MKFIIKLIKGVWKFYTSFKFIEVNIVRDLNFTTAPIEEQVDKEVSLLQKEFEVTKGLLREERKQNAHLSHENERLFKLLEKSQKARKDQITRYYTIVVPACEVAVECLDLKEALAKRDAQLKKVHEVYAKKCAELAEMREKNEILQQDNASFQQENAILIQADTEMDTTIDEKNCYIDELEEQLKKAVNKRDDFCERLISEEKHYIRLRHKFICLENELKETKLSLQEVIKQRDDFETKLIEEENQEQFEIAAEKLQKAGNTILSLEKELKWTKMHLQETRDQRDDFANRLAQEEKIVEMQCQALNDYTGTIEENAQRVSELRNQVAHWSNQAEEKQKEISQKVEEINFVKEQFVKLAEEKKSEINKLKEHCKKLAKENVNLAGQHGYDYFVNSCLGKAAKNTGVPVEKMQRKIPRGKPLLKPAVVKASEIKFVEPIKQEPEAPKTNQQKW